MGAVILQVYEYVEAKEAEEKGTSGGKCEFNKSLE